VDVTANGSRVILDAGTGIRALGAELEHEPPDELHIFLTHLHMDHLQGLGFFRPLFRPGTDVHLWGPPSPVQNLADRIAIYLSPPLFPVRLADCAARITFHDAPQDPITIGSATVRAANIAHQGPTVGYRIEEGDRSLAYLPDHEPSLGVELDDVPPSWISGHSVAADVDVLFHDAQYGDHEYPDHVGWGHSAFEHVMRFADKADVERVILFHHDPYHTDDELEALLAETHARWEKDHSAVCLAHEGMVVTLDEGGVAIAAV
jgi:phosphoribosyl 1,2-cyclic phosphodiesterase